MKFASFRRILRSPNLRLRRISRRERWEWILLRPTSCSTTPRGYCSSLSRRRVPKDRAASAAETVQVLAQGLDQDQAAGVKAAEQATQVMARDRYTVRGRAVWEAA